MEFNLARGPGRVTGYVQRTFVRDIARVTLTLLVSVCGSGAAWAQTAQAPPQIAVTATSSENDMKISVYPILLWAPVAYRHDNRFGVSRLSGRP